MKQVSLIILFSYLGSSLWANVRLPLLVGDKMMLQREASINLWGRADPLYDFPTAVDGVRGLAFIDTVIASNKSEIKWTKFVQ